MDRINETLGPALTTFNNAAALGFLTCRATGVNHSLVTGEFVGWDITEGADLFTPTHYLLALDETDFSNWGILSVDPDGWHAITGDLATHVVYSSKIKTSSQWQIASHAGVLPAMEDMLTQSVAAKKRTRILVTSLAEVPRGCLAERRRGTRSSNVNGPQRGARGRAEALVGARALSEARAHRTNIGVAESGNLWA